MAKFPYSGPPLEKLLGAPVSARGRAPMASRREREAAEIAGILRKGQAFQRKGDLRSAEGCYRAILQRYPEHPDALCGLGIIALDLQRLDDAVQLIGRAVAARPRDVVLQCELANALLSKRNAAEAAPVIQTALKLDPANIMARHLEAAQKAQMGKVVEARRLYEELVAKHPDALASVLELAHLCMSLGDFPAAREHYRALLKDDRWVLRGLCSLAECETLTPDSPEAAKLAKIAATLDRKSNEFANVERALGKIAEGASDYDAAMPHFIVSRSASTVRFDAEALHAEFDRLKALFTPEFFAERRHWGDPSERPVFVVGMPRSGTTLTEQIIASHPSAAGANELPDIPLFAASLGFGSEQGGIVRGIMALTPPATRELARKYLTVLDKSSPTALRVSDKMHMNFQHLGLIALLFPNARIIHCRRDPLDTCVSCFTTTVNAKFAPYVTSLASLGIYYREYVRLIEHWRQVLPLPMHESQYEELVESLEDRARALIEFVGLPWDPACLDFHEAKRAVHSASVMQVRKPIYKSSIRRWKRYEKYLGPLKEALGDLVVEA